MNWRSPFEDRIAEWVAEESASVETLPGVGKPVDLDAYFATPEDRRVGYALLRGSGFCPAEIDLMRQINRLECRAADAMPGDELETEWRRELTEALARLGLALEARGRTD